MATDPDITVRELFVACGELFDRAEARGAAQHGSPTWNSDKIIQQYTRWALVDLDGRCWKITRTMGPDTPHDVQFYSLEFRTPHAIRVYTVSSDRLEGSVCDATRLLAKLPVGEVIPPMTRMYGFAPEGRVVELGQFSRHTYAVSVKGIDKPCEVAYGYPFLSRSSVDGTPHIPGFIEGMLRAADFWRLVDASQMIDLTELIAKAPAPFLYHEMPSGNGFNRYDGDADLGPFPAGINYWYRPPSKADAEHQTADVKTTDRRPILADKLEQWALHPDDYLKRYAPGFAA